MTTKEKDNRNVNDTIKIAENLGFLISELVKLRVDKGLTQRDLAEITGLKQSAIARLEKLNAIPRVDTIITIAHFLGYTLTLCNYQYEQESKVELMNYHLENNGISLVMETGGAQYEIK